VWLGGGTMAALEIDMFTEGQDYGKRQVQEEFFCPFEICAYS
jgi:hypothetical protein